MTEPLDLIEVQSMVTGIDSSAHVLLEKYFRVREIASKWGTGTVQGITPEEVKSLKKKLEAHTKETQIILAELFPRCHESIKLNRKILDASAKTADPENPVPHSTSKRKNASSHEPKTKKRRPTHMVRAKPVTYQYNEKIGTQEKWDMKNCVFGLTDPQFDSFTAPVTDGDDARPVECVPAFYNKAKLLPCPFPASEELKAVTQLRKPKPDQLLLEVRADVQLVMLRGTAHNNTPYPMLGYVIEFKNGEIKTVHIFKCEPPRACQSIKDKSGPKEATPASCYLHKSVQCGAKVYIGQAIKAKLGVKYKDVRVYLKFDRESESILHKMTFESDPKTVSEILDKSASIMLRDHFEISPLSESEKKQTVALIRMKKRQDGEPDRFFAPDQEELNLDQQELNCGLSFGEWKELSPFRQAGKSAKTKAKATNKPPIQISAKVVFHYLESLLAHKQKYRENLKVCILNPTLVHLIMGLPELNELDRKKIAEGVGDRARRDMTAKYEKTWEKVDSIVQSPEDPIVNVFDYEELIAPVMQANHWTLVIINTERRTITIADSNRPEDMESWKDNPYSRDIILPFQKYIECAQFCLQKKIPGKPYMTVMGKNFPRQSSSYDSGIFMLENAARRLKDLPSNFTKKNIKDIRLRMMAELIGLRSL